MPSFSDRNNSKPKKEIQINSVDTDLSISIWNTFYATYSYNRSTDRDIGFFLPDLYKKIWADFLKVTVDGFSYDKDVFFSELKSHYFNSDWEWWKIYDFLEFVIENDKNSSRNKEFQNSCNSILERECSGYRFINDLIAPITSTEELEEIKNAIQYSSNEVKIHIQQALISLSNRDSPDYRNSIKESISAVEAQCRLIADDNTATLTKALDKIERGKQIKIHRHLKEAFQKIYSWTNDDEGIRHALKDEPTIDKEDAQFMLIACSAFINYLKIKKMKTESNSV